jgi:hypothetical protein
MDNRYILLVDDPNDNKNPEKFNWSIQKTKK